MKKVIKKWWFWLIIIIVIIAIIVGVCIKQYLENKELERKFEKMGEGASDFYKETQEAEGYLDNFTYNYSTGEVEYNPEKNDSWLEKYNSINKGMTVEQVVEILGEGYIAPVIDEITYFMNWGEKEGLAEGQIITIQFNNEMVYLKTHIGLE